LWQKSPFFNLPLMAICKSQFIWLIQYVCRYTNIS
jgi:hypothetical protein